MERLPGLGGHFVEANLYSARLPSSTIRDEVVGCECILTSATEVLPVDYPQ